MQCPPTDVMQWYEENRELFAPPVCNKLMHKEQLSVMFVGGPNTRTDFHIESGSEFFYQLKGNMELPTIQQGKRKLVKIREGQVFLLPSRVPHSPQRPEENSLGLVIERRREVETEFDCLRWYTDFNSCDTVLYERYFPCSDLGKDFGAVINGYKSSEELKTNMPTPTSVVSDPPLEQDITTVVPEPFPLADFIKSNREALAKGETLPLFPDHPDGEFTLNVVGGVSEQTLVHPELETVLMQIEGQCSVTIDGEEESVSLAAGGICVLSLGKKAHVKREEGSVGLVIRMDPKGNRSSRKRPAAATAADADNNDEQTSVVLPETDALTPQADTKKVKEDTTAAK